MYLPDYKGGSIVNLMSSIFRGLGGQHPYAPLRDFSLDFSHKNIVLLNIDGLGYNFLKKEGAKTFLAKNLKGKLTSVFPSTTATATTALNIGVPAQQHGLTGWLVFLKELALTARVLPFTARLGQMSLNGKINYADIFSWEAPYKKLPAESYAIAYEKYSHSDYSLAVYNGATSLRGKNLPDIFRKAEKLLKKTGKKRKFISLYWGDLDETEHKFGTKSLMVKKKLREIDGQFKEFIEKIKNTDTLVLVSADHGLIDIPQKSDRLFLSDHPKLKNMLTMPLCGEPRVAYCYVKPEREKDFVRYVKKNLAFCCQIYKSRELIEKNWFGLFSANPNLADRVGDYTLIMKDHYILKDYLPGEEMNILKASHGGVSEDEMFVPLIAIEV